MQDLQRTDPRLRLVAASNGGGRTKGAVLSATLRDKVIKEAGLGECSQLCDASEVEHVCDLVREAFKAAQCGSKTDLPNGLQTFLILPLQRYVSTLTIRGRKGVRSGVRMELEPTLTLIASAEEVIRRIDVGPWTEARADESMHLLRYAWCRWVTYVASYWLTIEVPVRLVEKAARREQGRLGGTTLKRGLQRSTGKAAEIVLKYSELLVKGNKTPAGVVARQFEVTATYVRQVWKKSLPDENTKQQASL